ncbi:hypothetical protein A3C23_02800 [Candidatus Roizmanbacteria bacterium RIFCSPHIGHO2_02_FULL_37_13b]|uniref:Glycosyltransferase RgtA/B/C/D-like domain-containing protein n=1 Tax=Candidatus Roizmanbacteria bacterium RIFCSPLOWO2_02_FULL_36_11 TaxID=1802071 RepID=A0A1F7JG59_9BACT|nr:MAG: hypothetical protein A3C23_02800 [Candidatus Roizmanbacteria bacterium RIFCSPHIGHO2_02_FULL_37_13b]OGK54603.1 MAG: hypothetical protein A3H78_01820 [Candidatus Roizmanbacteria bacterium RIFCSPLOWO2_02_FULL_36_11]
MKKVLSIYFIRLFFIFSIAYIAGFLLPYKGFFPYKELLNVYNLPIFIKAFANFDGLHYISIAQSGYYQYQQAFFPLYPIIIRVVAIFVGKNYLISGLLISNLSFLLACIVMYKLLHLLKYQNVPWFILLLFLFPSSFYFSTVYTESFFLLLFLLVIYLHLKKKYWISAIFSFFCVLTRLIGLFTLIFYLPFKKKQSSIVWLIIFPIFGLIIYMIYLFLTVQDPLFFLNSQPIFGAHRSTSLIFLPQVYYRYLKIFITANKDNAYFTALIEFFIFNFVFFILILDFKKRYKTNIELTLLNIFSLVNLILPTLTGTFSSIPRYAVMSLSIFFYLGELKNRSIKIIIAVLFFCLQVIMLSLFIQGYFIG